MSSDFPSTLIELPIPLKKLMDINFLSDKVAYLPSFNENVEELMRSYNRSKVGEKDGILGAYFVFGVTVDNNTHEKYPTNISIEDVKRIEKLVSEIDDINQLQRKIKEVDFIIETHFLNRLRVMILWMVDTKLRNNLQQVSANFTETSKNTKSVSNSSNEKVVLDGTQIAEENDTKPLVDENSESPEQTIQKDDAEIFKVLLRQLYKPERDIIELMASTSFENKAKFNKELLKPAIEQNLIEMTIPDKPNSRNQKYRITEKGKAILKA